MRAFRNVTAALLVAVLAAACGGSDSKGSSSTPSPKAADKAPTKAEAEAAIKAINLTAADLPGYKSEPADDSDGDDTPDDVMVCLGLPDSDYLAEGTSDDFSKGEPPAGVLVSSEVDVTESVEVAKKELAAYQGDKAVACLQKEFADELESDVGEEGVTVSPPKVTKGTSAATGTDGAFAFTITSSIGSGDVLVPVSIVVDGFLVKRCEVALVTIAFGEGPTDAEHKALVDKLVTRAKASAV